MRDFSQWLLHENQKELFEFLFAILLNILFLALIAGLLWPLDKLMLAIHLAKGYGIFWVVTTVAALLMGRIQRFFRVNLYERSHAFVISNLSVSCFLQVGWAAFVALTLHSFVPSETIWIAATLFLIGLFSCLVAFFAVSAFYQGHIYRLLSLPLALMSFLVFSVWPDSGRIVYGWFFALF
jgi:hypothetical protein